ncbi:MAG: hypothetical protein ACFCBU_15805 [Cyanophyceae cyanobacterium]
MGKRYYLSKSREWIFSAANHLKVNPASNCLLIVFADCYLFVNYPWIGAEFNNYVAN